MTVWQHRITVVSDKPVAQSGRDVKRDATNARAPVKAIRED